jgi:hypothetical protein
MATDTGLESLVDRKVPVLILMSPVWSSRYVVVFLFCLAVEGRCKDRGVHYLGF